ncbi:PREDICTED: rho guanine nucleotide exchange factor 7-like [Galeopterus variegatus]|uniref:Rho guanine nucleotide exchange factor 7-like n=1 Tax=Galeopterus variegatus TaxID=482537 RepID=A0ABM0SA99_GALVR|nr:PREDICTED: rho guanine nucleotide exchange factor 7-like [Galeopterus variegatus]
MNRFILPERDYLIGGLLSESPGRASRILWGTEVCEGPLESASRLGCLSGSPKTVGDPVASVGEGKSGPPGPLVRESGIPVRGFGRPGAGCPGLGAEPGGSSMRSAAAAATPRLLLLLPRLPGLPLLPLLLLLLCPAPLSLPVPTSLIQVRVTASPPLAQSRPGRFPSRAPAPGRKAPVRAAEWSPRSLTVFLHIMSEFGLTLLISTKVFDPDDLYSGVNFAKVLSTLLAVSKATEDQLSERPCGRSSSLSAANSSQTNPQGAVSTIAPGLQRQSKALEMTENGSHQLIVKARFNFKQTNEDELSVCKGDIIYVTRVEEGGWWEGTLNGRTGWFPSNYVREIKSSERPLSPKAVKGFESAPLTKNYYTVTRGSQDGDWLLLVSLLRIPGSSPEKARAARQHLPGPWQTRDGLLCDSQDLSRASTLIVLSLHSYPRGAAGYNPHLKEERLRLGGCGLPGHLLVPCVPTSGRAEGDQKSAQLGTAHPR